LTEPDTSLRRLVAAEHGLDADAARLIAGSTLAELEECAASLATLFERHGRKAPPAAGAPDVFTATAAGKVQRQRALLDAISDRALRRPEKERRSRSGFDGGARQSVLARPEPERGHNELVTKLLSMSRTFRGIGF
jgi:hypothetical protein